MLLSLAPCQIKISSSNPILEYLQPLFVCQHRRPSFTPIFNIRRNYSSLIKRSSEIMFKTVICWQKTKMMYKNQTLQTVIQHSVCFLHLIHNRYDTILRPSQYFLYIYDRWITFFKKTSQVPSYSTLHQSPANTLHVLLTIGLYTYVVKDV